MGEWKTTMNPSMIDEPEQSFSGPKASQMEETAVPSPYDGLIPAQLKEPKDYTKRLALSI